MNDASLPLFPLPDVVLFPNVFLPLHIFEPRYREMVADTLVGDRLIGMVLLQPPARPAAHASALWESEHGADDRSTPPVYPIGCSGLVTHAERLTDGRYNIVLRGIEKFRIRAEEGGRSYRIALVERVTDEEPSDGDRRTIREYRSRLEALVAPAAERAGADPRTPAAMGDEDLINALAQYLDFEPLEKQALLERPSLRARAESLVELLEMKMMMARRPWRPKLTH